MDPFLGGSCGKVQDRMPVNLQAYAGGLSDLLYGHIVRLKRPPRLLEVEQSKVGVRRHWTLVVRP
jgi:hypothetical protein